MTVKEAAQVLAILKAAYPNSYRGMTAEEATGTVSVWAMQFRDISADVVLMAVNKAIACSKFPPSICEVKDKISELHWEAYQIVSSRMSEKITPPALLDQYQRVYDETHDYRHKQGFEPTLREMMNNNKLLLGKGGN